MGVIEDTVNKKIADENVSIKFEKDRADRPAEIIWK